MTLLTAPDGGLRSIAAHHVLPLAFDSTLRCCKLRGDF